MSVNFNPSVKQNTVVKENKPSVGRKIAGYVAASPVYSACLLAPLVTTNVALIRKLKNTVQVADKVAFNKIVDSAMQSSGLSDAGVKIFPALRSNAKELGEILRKEYGILGKIYPKKVIDFWVSNSAAQLYQGANGVFAKNSNMIISGPEKSLLIFHEMGHAMNENFGKLSKHLVKLRMLPFIGGFLVTVALLKDKKQDGEKPEGFFDKTTTFIKNNIGKLAFASFIPMLAEEGLASIKGQKIAKKLVSQDVYRKVVKGNALGFSSYLLVALGGGIGATLANKLRDKIVHKKQS